MQGFSEEGVPCLAFSLIALMWRPIPWTGARASVSCPYPPHLSAGAFFRNLRLLHPVVLEEGTDDRAPLLDGSVALTLHVNKNRKNQTLLNPWSVFSMPARLTNGWRSRSW